MARMSAPPAKSWKTTTVNYTPVVSTIGNTGIPWNFEGEYSGASGGVTPLIFAAQKGDLESARMILDAGADVNQPSADGTTALLASLYKFVPNSTLQDRNQRGVFGGLSFAPDLKMANLLLDRGATPKAADCAGYTPLHAATLNLLKFNRRGEITIGFEGDKRNQPQCAARPSRRKTRPKACFGEAPAGCGRQSQCRDARNHAGSVGRGQDQSRATGLHALSSGWYRQQRQVDRTDGGAWRRRQPIAQGRPFALFDRADVQRSAECAGDGGAWRRISSGAMIRSDKIPDPVESKAEIRKGETALHIAAISGSNYVIPFLAAKGVPLDVKNDHGETALDLADAQERFRYARAMEAVRNQDKSGADLVRETQTSNALKKAMGRKVASNSQSD